MANRTIVILTLFLWCGSAWADQKITLDETEYVPGAMVEVASMDGHKIYTPAYVTKSDYLAMEDKTRSELVRIMWMSENDNYRESLK